jgi:hypothetical protein
LRPGIGSTVFGGSIILKIELFLRAVRKWTAHWKRQLCNTSLAPDHIRVAMVEAGYLIRDPAGGAYRVAEAFVGPEQLAERERALLRFASELDVQSDVVVCPACGSRMGATSLLGHCQRSHRWSARWPKLVEKYCR